MIERETITVYGVPLEVTAEVEEYDKEPYSWGQSRGTEKDVDILSVEIGEYNVTDLLSDRVIELLKEELEEE